MVWTEGAYPNALHLIPLWATWPKQLRIETDPQKQETEAITKPLLFVYSRVEGNEEHAIGILYAQPVALFQGVDHLFEEYPFARVKDWPLFAKNMVNNGRNDILNRRIADLYDDFVSLADIMRIGDPSDCAGSLLQTLEKICAPNPFVGDLIRTKAMLLNDGPSSRIWKLWLRMNDLDYYPDIPHWRPPLSESPAV